MCEEIEMSIQEYQEFIYKREEVKPYLKELDNIFQSTDQLDELDDKIDEVLCRFFNVESVDQFRLFSDDQLKNLELFEMYIYNEMEEL